MDHFTSVNFTQRFSTAAAMPAASTRCTWYASSKSLSGTGGFDSGIAVIRSQRDVREATSLTYWIWSLPQFKVITVTRIQQDPPLKTFSRSIR